jgi:uncharacterized protein
LFDEPGRRSDHRVMTPSAIDSTTTEAVREFTRRIGERYPLIDAYLFGSRARGTHRDDSDADVAVVLRGTPGPFVPTKLDMGDIAFDVLLETGIRIQPFPVWESEWQHPEAYSNPPLLRNIARDGIRTYSTKLPIIG